MDKEQKNIRNQKFFEMQKEKKEKEKQRNKRIKMEISIGLLLIFLLWGYKSGLLSNDNLITSVQKGSTVRVKLLLLIPNKVTETEVNDALLEAVYYNNLKLVKILKMGGADINYCGNDTFANPLIKAASYDYVDIAKYLLDNGANIHKTVNMPSSFTPLSTAVLHDKKKVAKLLVERDTEIDFKDNNGYTAFMYSMESELFDKELSQLLLAKGANIDATDNNGKSTILINISNGLSVNEEKIKFLLDNGANVNAENVVKVTPLIQAIELGNYSLAKLYIERGANVDAKDTWGQSPMSIAIKNKDTKIIAYLKGLHKQ